MRILGVDTSNYTTSLAVAEDGVITDFQKKLLPVADGEKGLRQSDAVFAHIKNLPELLQNVFGPFDGVAVSVRPRDVDGSYMPCFLVGKDVAMTAAMTAGAPLVECSHQAGHLRAALYSAEREDLIGEEYLAFHVSGGTTELLHVRNEKIELLGGSDDLHAGQLVDRIGVQLGLPFPCGPSLESLALQGKLPQKPRISVDGTHCHLSGAENKVMQLLQSGISHEDAAVFALEFIGMTLEKLTENARLQYPELPVIYAGGVMSNKRIRARLGRAKDVFFAEPKFSSDNAAGVALIGWDRLKGNTTA